MTRKYIIVAEDSIKGFDEEIAKLEREWGAEEIEPCEDCISREGINEFINVQLTDNGEWASSATNEGRWVEEKKYLYGVEILEGLSEYVNDLPSITPQRQNVERI